MNRIQDLKSQIAVIGSRIQELEKEVQRSDRKESEKLNREEKKADRRTRSRLGRLRTAYQEKVQELKSLGVDISVVTDEEEATVTLDTPSTDFFMQLEEASGTPSSEEIIEEEAPGTPSSEEIIEEEIPDWEEPFPPLEGMMDEEEFPPPEEKEPRSAAVKSGELTATLRVREPREESYWKVSKGGRDLLLVEAGKAYPQLDLPYSEGGTVFPTHWDCFQSREYGTQLCRSVGSQGAQKVASSIRGELLEVDGPKGAKKAPVDLKGTEQAPVDPKPPRKSSGLRTEVVRGVSKDSQGEGLEVDQHPVSETSGPPFEPGLEAVEQMTEEPQEKLPITDVMIDFMAPLVVNDAYTLEEIVADLEVTFSDEELRAAFQGALEERVDYLSEEISSEEEEEEEEEEGEGEEGEGEGVNPEEVFLPEELEPEFRPALRTAEKKEEMIPSSVDGRAAELEARIVQLEREKKDLEKQAQSRYQIHIAADLVKRMQGLGLLPSVQDLVERGYKEKEARDRSLNMAQARARRIADNDPDQFRAVINEVEALLKAQEEKISRKASVSSEEVPEMDDGLKTALASQSQEAPRNEIPARNLSSIQLEGLWTKGLAGRLKE